MRKENFINNSTIHFHSLKKIEEQKKNKRGTNRYIPVCAKQIHSVRMRSYMRASRSSCLKREKQEAKSLWHDDETNKRDKKEKDTIKLATRDVALAQEHQDLPTIDNTLSIVFTPLELKRSSLRKSWQNDHKQKSFVSFLYSISFFFFLLLNFPIFEFR